MNAMDFIISLIDASGGSIQGRTLLQKRAYFVTELGDIDVRLGFDAYFYGPYSSVVENAMTHLKNLRFVSEGATAYGIDNAGFEMKRYDYRLTADGESIAARLRNTAEYAAIKRSLNLLSKAGNPDYMELSIAAKALFILKKKKEGMSKAEILREAQKFDWNIRPTSLESAVSILEKLGMVRA
jgi:uncharacterized protein YwgA